MKPSHAIAIAVLVLAGAATPGCNQATRSGSESITSTPSKVRSAPNDAFISLTGTVVEANPNSFLLDYGAGLITVEMDDPGWVSGDSALLEDDRVVVHGYIDDSFYERRTLDATSVYVKSLGTQFFAAGADDADFIATRTHYDLSGPPAVELTGTVARIDGQEFELETGSGVVDVDTRFLLYNPLDDEGYQQIDEGDRVRVKGEIEQAFFLDQDLVATTLIMLQPNGTEK